VAVSGVVVMLALAGCGGLHWAVASAMVLIVASTVSVADNGLSFTSVAEAAGPSWSGKALGIQNTGQFIAASAVGPGIGALITAVGYPVAFALVASPRWPPSPSSRPAISTALESAEIGAR
jgi:MFS family permease